MNTHVQDATQHPIIEFGLIYIYQGYNVIERYISESCGCNTEIVERTTSQYRTEVYDDSYRYMRGRQFIYAVQMERTDSHGTEDAFIPSNEDVRNERGDDDTIGDLPDLIDDNGNVVDYTSNPQAGEICDSKVGTVVTW